MATVGHINQNGIVMFGKICYLPCAGMTLICPVIQKATGAQAGRAYYPYFEAQLWTKLVQ